jgi:hypothetical protein
MAIKLGTTTASLYLGSTPVAAYLGAEEVYSPVVTLYFDDAEEDGDWTTVGNWWLDAEHTAPAGRLPTAEDNVVLSASVTADGGSAQSARNLTMDSGELWITVSVTGVATFNGSSSLLLIGLIIGDATFNDSSQNSGTVTGTATFTGSACNNGGTAGTFVPATPPACV